MIRKSKQPLNFSAYILVVSALLFLASGSLFAEQIPYEKLIVSYQESIAIAKFNNPPRYTMDQTVVAELDRFLDEVAANDSVKVVILTGATDKIFIAHYDLGEIGTKSKQRSATSTSLHPMHRTLLKIEQLPKPVIAAIGGRAHGGGYETALACDFRFLSDDGTVGLPETRIGIIPGAGGTQRLSRLIGPAKAKELIMLGQVVNAETALQLGMVNRVSPADQLMGDALAFAKELSQRSPIALASVKNAIREGAGKPMEEALVIEQQNYYKAAKSVDWSKR